MPPETSTAVAFAVIALLAAALGWVLGWWPLTGWVRRSLQSPASSLRSPASSLRTVRVSAAVVTAITFGLLALRFGLWLLLPALLVFAASATVLSLIDLIEHRLPNAVVFPTLGVVALLLLVVPLALTGRSAFVVSSLVGAAAMFAVYLLLALISPGAMGMGDVKLALLIGLVLGWFGVTAWIIGLLAAFVIGGILAITGLALRRVTLRGSIPFGPSMLAGAVLALLFVGPPTAGG
ncbi:A24 family peptidase [Agromyces sp. Leaf222]|uniref:prepilin peptidase n=1 Tax=Agromyces sp. Leaf222 TaxID=1735688 RepID=UPI0006F71A34|nr:A24 family peptidase [Agromyces sp. Leaf222]KQM82316.1 hypothetical protein ASE68_02650 [Agromyces sp. Leaf222]